MSTPDSSFGRVDVKALAHALSGPNSPLVVDVRRGAAFKERPARIPTAVPLALDAEPLRLPDVSRERPVVVYCLCAGETSSSQPRPRSCRGSRARTS